MLKLKHFDFFFKFCTHWHLVKADKHSSNHAVQAQRSEFSGFLLPGQQFTANTWFKSCSILLLFTSHFWKLFKMTPRILCLVPAEQINTLSQMEQISKREQTCKLKASHHNLLPSYWAPSAFGAGQWLCQRNEKWLLLMHCYSCTVSWLVSLVYWPCFAESEWSVQNLLQD